MKAEIAVKERPILFSGAMVQAILAGRKTQTRRVMKPQPQANVESKFPFARIRGNAAHWHAREDQDFPMYAYHIVCPYGVPGDRLWVRETFALESDYECVDDPVFGMPRDGRPFKTHSDLECEEYHTFPRYRATENADLGCEHEKCIGGPCQNPWRPSIFMPRWASRLTLEITDVRVQRLQEISLYDAVAEGMRILDTDKGHKFTFGEKRYDYPNQAFISLWDSINAKRGYGWEKNPWVWAVSFRRLP